MLILKILDKIPVQKLIFITFSVFLTHSSLYANVYEYKFAGSVDIYYLPENNKVGRCHLTYDYQSQKSTKNGQQHLWQIKLKSMGHINLSHMLIQLIAMREQTMTLQPFKAIQKASVMCFLSYSLLDQCGRNKQKVDIWWSQGSIVYLIKQSMFSFGDGCREHKVMSNGSELSIHSIIVSNCMQYHISSVIIMPQLFIKNSFT